MNLRLRYETPKINPFNAAKGCGGHRVERVSGSGRGSGAAGAGSASATGYHGRAAATGIATGHAQSASAIAAGRRVLQASESASAAAAIGAEKANGNAGGDVPPRGGVLMPRPAMEYRGAGVERVMASGCAAHHGGRYCRHGDAGVGRSHRRRRDLSGVQICAVCVCALLQRETG